MYVFYLPLECQANNTSLSRLVPTNLGMDSFEFGRMCSWLTSSRDSFKSDKIAEVSYASMFDFVFSLKITNLFAAIQGRDCLIQKFRNSSVMLEPPHYRPKVCPGLQCLFTTLILSQLFITYNDMSGRVGEEDEFPASDNASKLKRSCENAEHVGKR